MGASNPGADDVRRFYDRLSDKSLRDYLEGNPRVAAQLAFLRDAIPETTRRILVIGCGSGEGAHYLARRAAPRACVVAVDISPANIALARRLFAHPRVAYRVADAVEGAIEGPWDAIVLPDVYEHIAREQRASFHAHLRATLSPRGTIALTVPSPAHQEALRERGEGLQPVDETVTLADLEKLARDIDGSLSYYALVGIWHTNDYVHAVVERGAEQRRSIALRDRTRLKRNPRGGPFERGARLARRHVARAVRFARVAWHCGLRSALAHSRPPREADATKRGRAG